MKIFHSDSTIVKYKDQIKKYNKPIKVKFSHYNYTCSDPDMPSHNLYSDFQSEYEELSSNFEKIGRIKSKEEIINKLDQYTQEIEKEKIDDYFDIKRAKYFL